MKFTKRILAFLLCAMMIVTVFPMGALDVAAEEATETASVEAAEASNYKPFHMHLDFEGMGGSTLSDYVTSNLKGVGASYAGNDTPVVVA